MSLLTIFDYSGSRPVPTPIAEALCAISTLQNLSLHTHGASIQYFTALRSSLITLHISCERSDSARGSKQSQAIDKNVDAIVEGLAQVLKKSSRTLGTLHLMNWETGDWLEKLLRQLAGPHAPSLIKFPRLTDFRFGSTNQPRGPGAADSEEFPRFLEMMPAVNFLLLGDTNAKSPAGPTRPLHRLKTLVYVIEPGCDCTASVRAFWKGSVLDDLRLDGIHSDFLHPIFTPLPNTYALRKLFLRVLSPFGARPLRQIFKSCPNIEEVKLCAMGWMCEMSDLLDELVRGAPSLTLLEIGHPWEHPRRHTPLSEPDGRSLRQDKYHNFKILNVSAGSTAQSAIVGLIKEDIAAVKPNYVKRFTDLAKRLPKLDTVVWNATEEVCWTWTFIRSASHIQFRQKSVVTFEGNPADRVVQRVSTVLLRPLRTEAHGLIERG